MFSCKQHAVVITLILCIIQVESMSSSSVKIQRTPSIRGPNPELRLKTRPASQLTSSTTSIASHQVESESKLIAGTSVVEPETDFRNDQRQEHQPLVERESKHVRVSSSINLIDPVAGTQSEHLDPLRDGVLARMRNRMFRYGSAAAVGSAIGAGGLVVAKQLLYNQNNYNITQPMKTTENLSNQTQNNDDDIRNMI